MSTLWVLGSLNLDEIVLVPRIPAPGETVVADDPFAAQRYGGKGANQAVAAAGAGARVRMIGAVGDDAAGRAYVRRLEGLGIGAEHVHRDELYPTGRAVVSVDPLGENAIVVVPGANAAVDDQRVQRALRDAEPGDVLLLSLEVPVHAVRAAVAAVEDLDVRVILNAAPFARLPQELLDRCDPVVVNEGEAMALADAGTLPASLLVTFGARGVAWNGVEKPAAPVLDVVDTTGAGDAFVGALAGRIALGDTDDEALDAALWAAAACIGREGAQPGGEVTLPLGSDPDAA